MDQEVESITLPGLLGEMTILPTHAAMVALLKKGRFHYKTANGKESSWFQIDGGFVEVLKNVVLVMTKSWQTQEANPAHH